MKSRSVLLALLSISVTGCSSFMSPAEDTRNFSDYIGVGNVEYNSQYHFGYDLGCQSALTVRSDGGDIESMKDSTLDGIAQFDDGWTAGMQACRDGQIRSMYSIQKP